MDLSDIPVPLERMPVASYSPHPLAPQQDRIVIYDSFLPNESVGQYLERHGLLAIISNREVVVNISGSRIPRNLWFRCWPKVGAFIHIQAIVRGGRGKNPIASVLLIALYVFAPQIAAAAQGAITGVTVTAATVSYLSVAAVVIVGSLAINALFPPPSDIMNQAAALPNESPTYSISGGSNQARPYEPLPLIFGTTKISPDFGALPYTEFEGDDQYLYQIFEFGYNDVDLSNFRIGSTPIEDFEGVTMQVAGSDGKLTLFPSNVDSVSGAALTEAIGWIQRTTSPGTTGIAVEIVGQLFKLSINGVEPHDSQIEIEYRLAGSPTWIGLDFESDVVADDTPVIGVAKLPDNLYISGTRKDVTTQPTTITGVTVISASSDTPGGSGSLRFYSTESVTNGTGNDGGDLTTIIQSLTWQPFGGVEGPEVRLFPYPLLGQSGSQSYQFNIPAGNGAGRLFVSVTPNFLPAATLLANSISVNANETPGKFLITSSTRSPLHRTFFWPVVLGQYEVRVQRSSPDETSDMAVSETIWQQLRSYQPDSANYTGRKRVALKIKASGQLQGAVDRFSAIAQARVPTWNGSKWLTTYTSNPGWLILAAARGKSAGQVNYLSLPAISGNYVSTPDRSELDITSSLDIRCKVRLTDWTPTTDQVLLAKASGAGNSSYIFRLRNTGTLRLFATTDGTTTHIQAESSVSTGIVDNTTKWVRVTRDGVSGDIKFYLSDDGELWVQLGTTQAASSTAIFAGTAPLEIGSRGSGTTELMSGRVYYAEVRNDIDGLIVSKFDPTRANIGDELIEGISGEIWTINQVGITKAEILREGFTRRAWGGSIPDSRIDIENLKLFAAWCDSKNLTFNGVFDRPMSVHDMLSAIALMGRGTVSNGSGQLGVIWDAPDLPAVAVIGMSNIVRDTFEIEYLTENLADEIVGHFINPDLDWQRDIVRVLAAGVTDPIRSRNVELFGCTDKDQAGKFVNLYIATNAIRTRKYKWQMDWDAMPLSRGEVAYFSHDLASTEYTGRLIEGSNTTTLKLERKVPLDIAGTYITIVKPDGTFASHAVQAGIGDTDTLTLTSALSYNPGADPNHPPYDYRWLYGFTPTPSKKIKIDSIIPKGHNNIELTAVDEVAEFYLSENDPYIYTVPAPVFNQPVINNLQLLEDGVRSGTGYSVRVMVSWDPGPGVTHFDAKYSVNGGPFVTIFQRMQSRSAEFIVSDLTTVQVKVIGYTSLGSQGETVEVVVSKDINFAGLHPPADVSDFSREGTYLRWISNPEADIVGYHIRYHIGNNQSWGDAIPLHDGLLTASPYQPPLLPVGTITFMIVAVDAAKLESVNPNVLVVGLGDPVLENVVETIDFEALSWPGSLTDGSEVATDLEADASTSFYSEDLNAAMYGPDSESFYALDLYKAMTYQTVEFTPIRSFVGGTMILEYTIQANPLFIEYRDAGQGPFYEENESLSMYTSAGTEPFYDAPAPYRVWPGQIPLVGGSLQLRITTGDGAIQGIIDKLKAILDAPDMDENFDNVLVPANGIRLSLTKPFTVIKNLQLTLEDDGGTAVSARYIDKDVLLGPLIQCIDGSQATVAGRVDVLVRGY